MSLSSIASLDDKREMIVNQALIMCLICKKINSKDKEASETPNRSKQLDLKKEKAPHPKGNNYEI